MIVVVNGAQKEINGQITVEQLLNSYSLDLSKTVVELNLKIIKKKMWHSTILKENDKLELVQFVGGG
jgi:thiamine biosynthesis protein ThiS